MADAHECLAHAEPIVDDYDADADEPILSATVGSGGVEVYMQCGECGTELEVTYEYVEAVKTR